MFFYNSVIFLLSFCLNLFQALKYSFQTHDRLCFVMEYANGGEVREMQFNALGFSCPASNSAWHYLARVCVLISSASKLFQLNRASL